MQTITLRKSTHGSGIQCYSKFVKKWRIAIGLNIMINLLLKTILDMNFKIVVECDMLMYCEWVIHPSCSQ